MKNRNKRISIRTTEQVEVLLNRALNKNEYKYYSKSDIVNLILEESLAKYADAKPRKEKK
ncbi:MAG: hypothetical protein LLG37_08525 [Spirochaetia bacterium]|nr:hypothetical protein [Spirochaetia bacterium]